MDDFIFESDFGLHGLIYLRFAPAAVPEPSTLCLLLSAGAGGAGLAFRRRRG
ncbi:MAG TPA: PEP-CTERM sorting domain-containing protein [Chthonomonadaceae bacterium]|nr:PEP-CTERM sorting domain-containing protein [Chthonomonadaceae bacterium]